MAQGKQGKPGIWMFIFPDRETRFYTGNLSDNFAVKKHNIPRLGVEYFYVLTFMVNFEMVNWEMEGGIVNVVELVTGNISVWS